LDTNSKEFVNSLKSGSEAAFTLLFNQFNLSLCSYAYRILNNNNDAKEIVHNTFCNIWDNRKSIEINESLKSYLYKSVYNNCISLLRKRKQYAKYVELGLGDLYFNRIVQNPHAELRIIDSETRKIILSAIEDLPKRCRDIFVKCKIDGLSYPKVAEELNISVKTVEAQMSIALKRLRKNLDWLLILIMG
jgi:RNA polymerase sigma-70 factor (ECF subfamily)